MRGRYVNPYLLIYVSRPYLSFGRYGCSVSVYMGVTQSIDKVLTYMRLVCVLSGKVLFLQLEK